MPDVSQEFMTVFKKGRRSAAVFFLKVVGDKFLLSRNSVTTTSNFLVSIMTFHSLTFYLKKFLWRLSGSPRLFVFHSFVGTMSILSIQQYSFTIGLSECRGC